MADTSIDEAIQDLVPFNSLSRQKFHQAIKDIVIEEKPKKTRLFNEGDTDNEMIYVLQGDVALKSESTSIERVISGGSEEAKYALAQLRPRQMNGIAKTNVTIARIDSSKLETLMTWDQLDTSWNMLDGYEVEEFTEDEDCDWMASVLQGESFRHLPMENLHALFARMEAVEAKAGEIVIKQGDPGDYYYIIKHGRAHVARKSDKDGKVTILAELAPGDSFGEEALLSGAPRNANIIMKENGVLMRLAKDDFDQFVKTPMVKWVELETTRKIVSQGGVLIDVRLEAEHKQGAIKGSINIPLYLLRLKAAKLDHNRRYVVYCASGNRSTAAAFLLAQRGFDVSVLKGGLVALTQALKGN